MKSMYDVRQLLKKYGTLIYTGERSLDLSLMEDELRELHEWKMIETTLYMQALHIIRQEQRIGEGVKGE
ncbi:YqgQ family protein [Bacillus sp. JCM 19034]|uniref:YqgQ family protein n=1 Tax=Bacillus sp. JCM 19034 TaxID=1481928 RepID=UPI000780AA71|nr:YqgQ family protein [Bacillus sp. JCM 19034]